MERVLVTGATGLIGLDVVRELSDRGVHTRALVRRPTRAGLLHGLDVEPVQGDLTRPESLRRAVAGVDTVIHLAARATMEPVERLRPTIVDGTRALAEAAVDEGVSLVVYASSLLTHGSVPPGSPIDAATPTDPQVGYGVAKVEAEAILDDLTRGTGTEVATVRLPHVYGPGDLLFSRMRRGLLVTPGLGANLYAHLHIEDAARLLVEVARQRWVGASATADQRPATWREFFSVVGAHFARFRHLRVPAPIARLGATLLDALDPRSRPTVLTPDAVVGWNLSQPVAAGLIWDDLDVEPRYRTIETGVPAALDGSLLFRWRHPVDDPT